MSASYFQNNNNNNNNNNYNNNYNTNNNTNNNNYRSASPFLSDYHLSAPLPQAHTHAHAHALSHSHSQGEGLSQTHTHAHARPLVHAHTPLSSQSYSSFSSSAPTPLSLSLSSSHSSHNNNHMNNHMNNNNNNNNNYYQYENANISNSVNSSVANRPLPVPPLPTLPLQESNDLFVGDLSFFCTDEALLSLFAEYCDVERAHVVRTQDGSRSRTFGFVTLAFPQQRESVAALMNGQLFMGRQIRVELVDKSRPNSVRQRELAGYELHVSFSASARAPVVTEMVLRRVFMRFGVILDVVVRDFQVNKELGVQQGYAFVAFADLSIALSLLFRSFSAQGLDLKCTAGHKIQQYIQQRALQQQQQREEDAAYAQVPWSPRQEMLLLQQQQQQQQFNNYEREGVREGVLYPHSHAHALSHAHYAHQSEHSHRSSLHSVSVSPPLPSPRVSSCLPLSSYSDERERETNLLLNALLTTSSHENNTLSSLLRQEPH